MGGGRGGKKCFKATDGVWKLPLKSKDIHHIITLLGSLMSFFFFFGRRFVNDLDVGMPHMQ